MIHKREAKGTPRMMGREIPKESRKVGTRGDGEEPQECGSRFKRRRRSGSRKKKRERGGRQEIIKRQFTPLRAA